jgi:Tfp pilus assembly protein PilX
MKLFLLLTAIAVRSRKSLTKKRNRNANRSTATIGLVWFESLLASAEGQIVSADTKTAYRGTEGVAPLVHNLGSSWQ